MIEDNDLPVYGHRPVPGVASTGQRYSSWLRRAMAFAIDIAPVLILFIGTQAADILTTRTETVTQTTGSLTYEAVHVSTMPRWISWTLWAISLLIWIYNKGIREGRTGKSWGKSALKMTTSSDGVSAQPLGPVVATIRSFLVFGEFTMVVCIVGIVLWFWPLWDQKHQALLSDKLTGAVVFDDSTDSTDSTDDV